MQLAAPLRFRARTILVVATALTLIFGTLVAPARAGDDGDDVESARAAALETVNWKINSLKECREDARTDQAWAIYSEGIEELEGIKVRILEEDNAEEIYALKSQAKAVWAETKELAAAADAAKDGDDGEEDDKAAEEEERRRREAEEQRRREREKAEAALAEARAETLSMMDKKIRLMTAASQSAHHDQMSDIYRHAAMAIEDLLPEAQEADSIDELEEIAGQVWEIIHAAKEEIAAFRPGHDKDDDGEYDDDELGDKKRRDDNRDEDDEEGDDEEGDDEEGDDEEGDDGTEGEETDGAEEGGETPVAEDDGAEEEQTILRALNAMELEVDNYQIAIQNTMSAAAGFGVPEGVIALEAGWALLDAIDASRTLTGDELVLAWADIMDQRSAYIHLVMEYDREWEVGLFTDAVSPE